ncbi:MAG: cell envelope integrity protein TolA [Methylotenera sp.]|nr:cell envelope integrity protein TolA [Oligoflexia bacterium]
MDQVLPPTARPPHPSEGSLEKGLRWSFIAHGVLLLVIIIKSVIFPGKPVLYIPSLRVDVVGLPDLLKKDLANVPKTAPDMGEALKKAETDAQKIKAPPPEPKAPKIAEKAPEEVAKPDDMVLHPKKLAEKVENKKDLAKKNRERLKELTQDHPRDKKLRSALDRIKSLNKISAESETKGPASPVIKGNAISHGTSLSGDARENAESGYMDLVRDKLQDKWELPVWIQRQKLSAQVQIFIDMRGRLNGMRIMKSSGNAAFDEAVKKTVTASAPFPVPPAGIAGSLSSSGILVGFPL